MRDQREIIAYHEAGHAVMAMSCGFTVECMSIRSDATSGGRVIWQAPNPPTADSRRRSVLIAAGGMAADYLHWHIDGDPSEASEGHNNDRAGAGEHLLVLGHAGLFDVYLVQATRQLEVPERWALVAFTADLLLKAETVNGRTVLRRMFDSCPKIEDADIQNVIQLADFLKSSPDRYHPLFPN